ncbi:MAG: hypothetical protein R3F05_18440 [Planctomycetota bacterium]
MKRSSAHEHDHDAFGASDPLAELAAMRPGDPRSDDVGLAATRIEGRLRLRGAPASWWGGRRMGWAIAVLVALGVGRLSWWPSAAPHGRDTGPGHAAPEIAQSTQPVAATRDEPSEPETGDGALVRTVADALAGDGLARTRLRGAGPEAADVLWRHVSGGGAPGVAAVLRRRMPWTVAADEAAAYAEALGQRGQAEDAGPVALLLWVRGGPEGQQALEGALAARLDLVEPALGALAERGRAGSRWRSLVLPLADRSAAALACALDVVRPGEVGSWDATRLAELLMTPRVRERLAAMSPVLRRDWLRAAERGSPVAGMVVGKAGWREAVPLLEVTVRRAPLAGAVQAIADLEHADGTGAALALARLAEDAELDGPVRRAVEHALVERAPAELASLEAAARRQHGVRFAASRALARAGVPGLDALVRLTARGTTREQALGALAAAPTAAADARLLALIDGGGIVGAEALRHLVGRLEREPSAEDALVSLLATRHRADVLEQVALSDGEHAGAFLKRHGDTQGTDRPGRPPPPRPRGGPAAQVPAPPDPRPPL